MRRRRYDAVLNLHGGSTSLFFTAASAGGLTLGQDTHRQSWLYDARIPPSSSVWGRQGLHTVEHQLTPMRWLGLPVPDPPVLRLYPSRHRQASVEQRLSSAGLEPGSYVVIHPTATLETKTWPAERFAAVADEVHRESGLRVLLTAAAHESAVLDRVRASCREHHLAWSDLDLAELFWVIRHSRMFVGNDSGPMHAAAALARPLVAVWGSSNFVAWHPWGTRFESVRSDLPCMPCPGYSCAQFGRPRCILDIPSDRVVEACRKVLADGSEGR
jgi:ADP-heptose:LPS heptosyltransferase